MIAVIYFRQPKPHNILKVGALQPNPRNFPGCLNIKDKVFTLFAH